MYACFVRSAIALCIVLTLPGCLLFEPRATFRIQEPYAIERNSCDVTIVRRGLWFDSIGDFGPLHIALDADWVAVLNTREYTKFRVSEGDHSLIADWQIPRADGVPFLLFYFYYVHYQKGVRFACTPSAEYLFTVNDNAWKFSWNPKPEDHLEIKQVPQLEGDYAIERNKYVPAGPRSLP